MDGRRMHHVRLRSRDVPQWRTERQDQVPANPLDAGCLSLHGEAASIGHPYALWRSGDGHTDVWGRDRSGWVDSVLWKLRIRVEVPAVSARDGADAEGSAVTRTAVRR